MTVARPAPRLVHTRAELAAARAALGAAHPGDVAVVMTMGALHDGHATLMRTARAEHGALIATIFVNPLQFGPNEDFGRYPRTLDADLEVCQRAGVDVVFAPSPREMYPHGEPSVRVTAGGLATLWEGAHRPGHFDGVLTVVAKLLHLTGADYSYYGQKDAQQLLVIRSMVRDLNLPVKIRAVPIVREPDGLAMSSRNRYLSDDDRRVGLALSRALRAGADRACEGAGAVRRAAGDVLADAPELELDYLALVDPATLHEVPADHEGLALLAVAGRVGTTRLIDNQPMVLGVGGGPRDIVPDDPDNGSGAGPAGESGASQDLAAPISRAEATGIPAPETNGSGPALTSAVPSWGANGDTFAPRDTEQD